MLISPFHSVVFTLLKSERNFFLEKELLSYMFQALIGELVVNMTLLQVTQVSDFEC